MSATGASDGQARARHAEPDAPGRWYLVQSKPRQERLACENLRRQHYEAFLPLVRMHGRRKGEAYARVEPMFPRYLFVRLRPAHDNFAPIRSTLGVTQLVRFGDAYARAPDELVASLQAAADADGVRDLPPLALTPGARVELLDGVMAGYEAIFTARRGRDRVALLLEIAGRQVEIEVRDDGLRPLT